MHVHLLQLTARSGSPRAVGGPRAAAFTFQSTESPLEAARAGAALGAATSSQGAPGGGEEVATEVAT